MSNRQIKDVLYAQVARIGKAICSPQRLELIEILCQGEKSVEQLANDAEISVKLASAHLKELRIAQLVEARREGKNMVYRLSSTAVADSWVAIRSLAEDGLVELRVALAQLARFPGELSPVGPWRQRSATTSLSHIRASREERPSTPGLRHAQDERYWLIGPEANSHLRRAERGWLFKQANRYRFVLSVGAQRRSRGAPLDGSARSILNDSTNSRSS